MKVRDTMWTHQVASANPIMSTFSIYVVLGEVVGIDILPDCLYKFSERWSRDSGNHQVSESLTSLCDDISAGGCFIPWERRVSYLQIHQVHAPQFGLIHPPPNYDD